MYYYYAGMETIFFNRVVELLLKCPHFRGLYMFVDRHDSFKDDDKYSASNVVGIHPRDWNLIKSTTNLFSKAGVIKPASWSKIVDIQETGKLIHTSIKITTGKNKNRGTFCLSFWDDSSYPIPTYLTSFDDNFRALLYEKAHADFFTLEFPPPASSHSSNNNSRSHSSSNSSSNSNSNIKSSMEMSNSNIINSNSSVVNLNDVWDSTTTPNGMRVKSELVNSYLAAEISTQGGSSNDKPVEIVVKFYNTVGSLFLIKHKRECSNSNSNSIVDNEFINFRRRISHDLLQKMHKTQGHGAMAYEEAIANLAHQVHTLNPSACLHAHKSYNEILDLLVKFDKNARDVDDQFEGLIPPEMQLQDLEGGMEEGDGAARVGAVGDL